MKSWTIREFTQDDISEVTAINRGCLPENYPEQFFLGLHHHAQKAFLVAEEEEKIIGYIMCRIERGVSHFGRMPVKKGHVVSVAVIPEYRHQGIGSELIVNAMRAMDEYGASEYFLEVRKTNQDAVSVYDGLGFEVKRVLKGYYRDGEDAYLMVKQKEESSGEDFDE